VEGEEDRGAERRKQNCDLAGHQRDPNLLALIVPRFYFSELYYSATINVGRLPITPCELDHKCATRGSGSLTFIPATARLAFASKKGGE
jgi:hypothetical protein